MSCFLGGLSLLSVVLKSVGFPGLISLSEFIGIKNSFAGIAGVRPLTVLKKRVSRYFFLSFFDMSIHIY